MKRQRKYVPARSRSTVTDAKDTTIIKKGSPYLWNVTQTPKGANVNKLQNRSVLGQIIVSNLTNVRKVTA